MKAGNKKPDDAGKTNRILEGVRQVTMMAVVSGMFVFQLWETANMSAFERVKRRAQTRPDDLQRQRELVELSLDYGDLETAGLVLGEDDNLRLAMLESRNAESVLGSTTNKIEQLKLVRESSSMAGIRRLIDKWEKIREVYTGYRDAYLQLTALYSRVNELVTARNYLKIAEELDPNSEKLSAVRALVEKE